MAAIIVEPVAGSAGWYLPPKGYLKRLREICDKHGILLIFDEVITGFGRMGTNFGADFYGVVPDMLNFAKCVTNGVIPLGGVICRDHLYDAMMKTESARARDRVLPRLHLLGPPGGLRRGDRHAGPVQGGKPVRSAPARWARCWVMPCTARSRACPTSSASAAWGWPAAVELAPIAGAPGKRAYDIFLDCFHKGALVRPAGDVLVHRARPTSWKRRTSTQLVNTLADSIRRHA